MLKLYIFTIYYQSFKISDEFYMVPWTPASPQCSERQRLPHPGSKHFYFVWQKQNVNMTDLKLEENFRSRFISCTLLSP